ncbi:MAG: TonB-dependent receptor, partial [Pseudomonadota bacterium]
MFRKALAFILWIVILTTSKAYAYVDEEFDIRIPAQAVADGVKKLSHQTNRSVLFQTDQLSNTRTNAVSGRYSIEDALAALLDGTNLKGDLTESGVIVISLQKGADASHLEGTSMKRTTLQKSLLASVSALIFGTGGQAALAQDGAQEDTIVVQGTQFFDRSQSSSAAKLPLNLVETPQSVSVLNEDLIDTFAITRLNDLYKYVAGLDQRSKGSQGELFNGGVTARGFDLDVLDGFKFNGISFIPVQPVDTIVLERTEFLKGPSGIIYGRNNYGGIVNFVSKKPKDQEFAQIGAHIGNYDLYRFEADVNTPLVDDILSVRLPLAFESTNSYLEEDSKQFTAAPSILFTPTDRLTVDVSAIIQNWQSARQLGVPTYTTGTTYADVNWDEDGTTSCFQLECSAPPESISDVLFAPDWQNYEGESVQAFARVGYEFAPDWEAFISASNLSSSFYTDQYLLGTLIAENGDTGFISFLEDREDKSSSVEVGITGEFTA